MSKFEAFEGLSDEWIDMLDDGIDDILSHISNYTPTIDKIFEFARITDLDNIKIVILGQDPYLTAGYAHGLSFSSLIDIPLSLSNIYKCLIHHKLLSSMPTTGDLTPWAEQGVLLLNCSLTTCKIANAHERIWKQYINRLIGKISQLKNDTPIIFMLWGLTAKDKEQYIDKSCIIMTHTHPSPQNGNSFLTCDHFIKANNILRKYKQIINWNPVVWKPYEIEFGYNSTNKNTRIVVFTDGSAYPNKIDINAIAGYGAVFVLGEYKDIQLYGNIENRPHYATNQRAEGAAIFKTLQFLSKNNRWEECIIVSDSEFWIKMFIEYMPQWSIRDIDFHEKKNSDMTIPMWDLYSTLIESKTIEFRHIKSHNKEGWNKEPINSYKYFCYHRNNYVDELANYARKNLKPGEHKMDRVEY